MHHSDSEIVASSKYYYRVSCTNCRSIHKKCSRELPSCLLCRTKGITCCYSPPKRRARANSDNQVVIEEVQEVGITTTTQPSIVTTISLNNNTPPIALEIQSRFKIYQPVAMTMDDKIHTAEWYATRAVFMLQAPAASDHPQRIRQMCENVCKQLSKASQTGGSVNELYNLIQTNSRSVLHQHGLNMFNKAKEIVLQPNVYPYIASNAVLANTCSSLATFLLLKGRHNIPESKLFASAVEVFVKESKSIISESKEMVMMEDRNSVQLVSHRFYSFKMMLFFFSDSSTHTMKDLIKILQSLQKITKLERFSSEQSDTWTRMIHIINEYSGVTRTKLLLESLDQLVTHLTGVQIHEYRIALIRGLQTRIINIEFETTTDINDRLELKALQLKYLQLGIAILSENRLIAEYNANGAKMFEQACEFQLEYCDKLLHSENGENVNVFQLSEVLTHLQTATMILSQFQNEQQQPIYADLAQKLNSRIFSLLKLQQTCIQQQQVDSTIVEDTTEFESIDWNIEDFFDHVL
jgi:hypothetical protein